MFMGLLPPDIDYLLDFSRFERTTWFSLLPVRRSPSDTHGLLKDLEAQGLARITGLPDDVYSLPKEFPNGYDDVESWPLRLTPVAHCQQFDPKRELTFNILVFRHLSGVPVGSKGVEVFWFARVRGSIHDISFDSDIAAERVERKLACGALTKVVREAFRIHKVFRTDFNPVHNAEPNLSSPKIRDALRPVVLLGDPAAPYPSSAAEPYRPPDARWHYMLRELGVVGAYVYEFELWAGLRPLASTDAREPRGTAVGALVLLQRILGQRGIESTRCSGFPPKDPYLRAEFVKALRLWVSFVDQPHAAKTHLAEFGAFGEWLKLNRIARRYWIPIVTNVANNLMDSIHSSEL